MTTASHIVALLVGAMLLCFLPSLTHAFVNPDEQLSNPVLEQRARDISKDIRCPVCGGQTIEGSNADVARDLRLLIRERLIEGDTNEEIIDYLRARYGDEILMNPPMLRSTTLLWLGPFLVFMLGGTIAGHFIRKAQK